MKILRIGDPHVKVSNLEESEKLMAFALNTAIKENVDAIDIMGDLFHTHAVLRVEVLDFWHGWLAQFGRSVATNVLVGNHDQTGDYSSNLHALNVLKNQNSRTTIFDEASISPNGIFAYVPYIHHEEMFINTVNALAAKGAKVLVCHQTFKGSQYDNGMYAPDGFDPEKLLFDLIISGHIHKRQRYGKIIYPGTGRWDTASDANEPKGLWLVEHDDSTGTIISEKFIDTSEVVMPMYAYQWREGDSMPELRPNSKTAIELIGTSEWVSKQRRALAGKAALSAKITDAAKRASRKPSKSVQSFIEELFEPIQGVSKQEVLSFMKELDLVG